MRIAIVDDNKDMLALLTECVYNTIEVDICICDSFQKIFGLLDKIENGKKYDIYFLDIEMPEMNGLELAKKIRTIQKNAYIVFITAYEKYVIQSYDVKIQTYQYILKEKVRKMLPEVLCMIETELEKEKDEYYIIQNTLHYEKIKITDIIYMYKENKNSLFVTSSGICKERKALRKVVKELNKAEFIFVDPGRVVNIRYIQRISGDKIFLVNNMELYASRVNMKKVKKAISEYWSEIYGNRI